MKDVIVYKDYVGSVHYSQPDDVFYGKVEGIDDLVHSKVRVLRSSREHFMKLSMIILKLHAPPANNRRKPIEAV